jgi:hypothetical protein
MGVAALAGTHCYVRGDIEFLLKVYISVQRCADTKAECVLTQTDAESVARIVRREDRTQPGGGKPLALSLLLTASDDPYGVSVYLADHSSPVLSSWLA